MAERNIVHSLLPNQERKRRRFEAYEMLCFVNLILSSPIEDSIYKISEDCNIPKSCLSTWINSKEKLEKGNAKSKRFKPLPFTHHKELESELLTWFYIYISKSC